MTDARHAERESFVRSVYEAIDRAKARGMTPEWIVTHLAALASIEALGETPLAKAGPLVRLLADLVRDND